MLRLYVLLAFVGTFFLIITITELAIYEYEQKIALVPVTKTMKATMLDSLAQNIACGLTDTETPELLPLLSVNEVFGEQNRAVNHLIQLEIYRRILPPWQKYAEKFKTHLNELMSDGVKLYVDFVYLGYELCELNERQCFNKYEALREAAPRDRPLSDIEMQSALDILFDELATNGKCPNITGPPPTSQNL